MRTRAPSALQQNDDAGNKTIIPFSYNGGKLEEAKGEWRDVQHLRFVIEAISPSTAQNDRFTKRRAYQKHGVETYWIVDPYKRIVEVWTHKAEEPLVHTDRVSWRQAPEAEPFVVNLPDLWARVR